jgi:exopolysaccharide biosynthesis polyprenyl glycosylphosphotransferase
VAILFQYRFDIFSSIFTMSIAIGWAAVVQLLLLVHLPSNDVLPRKIARDGTMDFLKGEAKFILSLTFMAFFTKWQISEVIYTVMLATNAIIQSLLFLAWRVYNRHIITPMFDNTPASYKKNVLIVGSGDRGQRVADLFLDHSELNIYVLGFVDSERTGLWRYRDIPLKGNIENLTDVISCNQVDLVVMAMENGHYRETSWIFDTVEKMGVKICILPEIVGTKISKCRPYSLNGQPVFLYHSVPENRLALLIKEIMDRVGAVVGLVLSIPIMALAALAIRFDSKGPIFYHQRRAGKNGKIFEMIKLRTMVNEADRFKERLNHLNEMTGPVFKIQDDPRVTRVGRFLRKYSIDEFPQFWNVLKGDMSLVGPRPPLPQEVEKFEPWQHRKLSVKPGLSCLWQVNGRNNVDFDHWMKLDLEYIDRWSLAEDAKILIKTIPAVLKGRGAC